MVKKEAIAIIPARGGSKRMPGKNIVDFFGKPLLAWTIEAARESGIFDRILVSTEDPKVAAVTERCGAEVPFLRHNCFEDYSPVSAATISALRQVQSVLNEDYENVVQLMPNCPLRQSRHIVDAFHNFLNGNSKSQISCFKFGWMNPWWAVTLDEKFSPSRIFPENYEKRSQDLPQVYCPTGAIWIAKCETLIQEGSFYGKSHVFYPMDWQAAIDIDDSDDLEMAKCLFQMNHETFQG